MISRHKKILTFFAHPDDETLAAGGTIAKLCEQGAEVHVAIPATGIHSRRSAAGELGVADPELEWRLWLEEQAAGG